MKQGLYNPDAIFRATFNNEATEVRNEGTVTNVTFDKGGAYFSNAANSKIEYFHQYFKTVRIICTLDSTTEDIFKLSSTHSISANAGTLSATGFSSPSIYVNGVLGSTVSTAKVEIIISTSTLINANDIILGRIINSLNGSVDLVEFYRRKLNEYEVLNLFERKTFVQESLGSDLLDIDSRMGVISERTGKSLTNTNVNINKTGSYTSMKFDGVGSKLDTGADMIGSKGVTVYGWVKFHPSILDYSRIMSNLKLEARYRIGGQIDFSSDGSTLTSSSLGSIEFNKLTFLSLTRDTDGTVNFYIGDKDTPPTLSGSADQDSGTPTEGFSNIIVGNRQDGSKALDGIIPFIKVKEQILTLQELTQIWSSTKHKV